MLFVLKLLLKILQMNFFQSLLNIFYPTVCLACGSHLVQNEDIICSSCRHQLPITDFFENSNNLIENAFKGRIPIIAGTALLYYRKKGVVQELIHALKYKGHQEVGEFFGMWMGKQLVESKRFNDLDAIILVPLHPKRLKTRGYNQLTIFSDQLSKELGIPVYKDVLVKIGKSASQTNKNRFSRFEKINEYFHITDTTILEGMHVLLVDDVFTTGATLEACANEIYKTPEVRISIATMVVSDHY